MKLSIVGCGLILTAGLNICHAAPSGQCTVIAQEDIDGCDQPNENAKKVFNVYKKGDCINVKCRVIGSTVYVDKVWDYDGTYFFPDQYVQTIVAGSQPDIELCASINYPTPPADKGPKDSPPTPPSPPAGENPKDTPPTPPPTTPPTTPPTPPPSGGSCGGHLDKNGLTHLTGVEGFRPDFYNDNPKNPEKDKTIGYGHNCDADKDKCASIKAPITKAQGEELLQKDLVGFESFVCRKVVHDLKCPLNCNQFSALVSYAFNAGNGGLQNSEIYKNLANKCNFKGAADVWTRSKTNGGILVSRRKKEVDLFNTASSTSSGC